MKLVVVVTMLAAIAVHAQQAPNADDLRKQRTELQAKVRDLDKKLGAIRGAVAKDAALTAETKAVSDARAAIETKTKGDAKVVETSQAAAAAEKRVREVSEAEVAAAPEVVTANKEIAGKQAEIEELEAQQRLARFLLSEAERKVAGNAEVKKSGAAAREAQDGIKAAHDANARLVAAAKTVADARAALSAKVKALPETAALEQAEKAYQELVKADAGLAAAKTKAEEARKAAAEVVQQKLAGTEQQKKAEEVAGKLKSADEALRAAQKKAADTRREVVGKSAKVAEAQKAVAAANDAGRQAAAEATKAERAALADAEKALAAAVDKKLESNADAQAVNKEKAELVGKIKALDEQIHPPKPAKKKEAAKEPAAKQ